MVKQPKDYSVDEIIAQIEVTKEQITKLKEMAPELRRQHLHKRHSDALWSGSDKKAAEIAQIISRESLKARFKEVNRTTRRRKGGGKVFRVEREEADGSITSFSTKEAVEAVVGQSIGERYRLAYSAPIMSNDISYYKTWASPGTAQRSKTFFWAPTPSLLRRMSIRDFFALRQRFYFAH